jgi:hypothetical protein
LDILWSSSCLNWTESLLPLCRWFFLLLLSVTKAENTSLALCTRTLFLVQWTAFRSCSLLDPLTCLSPSSSSFSISSCTFPPSTFSSFCFEMVGDSILCLEKICLSLVARLLAIQSFPALSCIIHVCYSVPFVQSYLPSRHSIFTWTRVVRIHGYFSNPRGVCEQKSLWDANLMKYEE